MTLYIIGNGFDLHHGLKTTFTDYSNYLKKNNYTLYETLSNYLILEQNWNNFEESFSDFRIMEKLSDLDDFLPAADNESSGKEWIYNDQAEDFIRNILQEIQNTINDWICSLDYTSLQKSQHISFENNSRILSFNYSQTVEILYKPKNRVLHIHNMAKKREKYSYKPDEADLGFPKEENSEVIVGHKKNNTNPILTYTIDPIFDPYQNLLRSNNFETLSTIIDLTTKDTKSIINNNQDFFNCLNKCDSIKIYGHSLGECDIPYFEEIIKSVSKSATFTFYYHSSNDLATINNFKKRFLNNYNTNEIAW